MTIKTLGYWLASRARRVPCDTIVLHATAGSTFTGALKALKDKELSYHYIIEDEREHDGQIRKCVPYSRVAFHAGASFGPRGSGVNNYSVGISFVNRNDGVDGYSLAQIQAARDLILELKAAIPTLRYITTHYAISPGRKTDPRNFPVKELAAAADLQTWGIK